MGILNLTPDSFSDGGAYPDVDAAVSHGRAMAGQGADLIDVGGESTRPGAGRVAIGEQVARVAPVIRALRKRLDEGYPHIPISIDTTRVPVAEAACEAGATILNDISGGLEDPGMFRFAAERQLPIVLMHMQGEPGTMQANPTYGDVVHEVKQFLTDRARAAIDAGIDPGRIVLDPGIGFGKTTEHNLALLRAMDQFVATGYPILVGASRKRFIEELGGGAMVQAGYNGLKPPCGTSGAGKTTAGPERLGGTCAVSLHCVRAGVQLLRIHDVAANRQAIGLMRALESD